jgi:hypothetical protein
VSDQDFFFDDEDEAPAKQEKAAKKAPAKSAAATKPASGGKAPASFWEQTTTMMVTGLVGVIGLLLGVIVGVVLPVGSDVPAPTVDGSVSAPALSPEQLETGELPQGHPDIGDMTGGEAPAPTEEPTDTAVPDSTETTE